MRLHRLDLNLLVVLDRLMAERSVSQTAQQLSMTQPAISNALNRLRTHFDDELFIVLGRKLAPTPLCESLAEPVRRIIGELTVIAALRPNFDPATTDRTFTIICSDYVFLVFLSEALRDLAHIAPSLNVRCLLTNENMAELLRNGTADFCITPQPRMVEGMPSEIIFEDDFSVISWTDNKCIDDILTTEIYLASRHVSTSIGPTTPPHIEQESLERHGVVRDIAIYAPNFTSVAEVVVGTDFIATVHSKAAALLSTRLPIRIFKPPLAIESFKVGLQWNPARSADPGLMWMKEYLMGRGERQRAAAQGSLRI